MTDNTLWDKTEPSLHGRIRGWVPAVLDDDNDFALPAAVAHRTAVAIYFNGTTLPPSAMLVLKIKTLDEEDFVLQGYSGNTFNVAVKRLYETGSGAAANFLVGYA